MSIRAVEFITLTYPLAVPYGDANGLKSKRSTVLLRLVTADGIVGIGEFFNYRLVPDQYRRARELALDADERASEVLVRRLAAISPVLAAGFDIALWDIKGKRAGMGIAELMGGPFRAVQPAYASLQNVVADDDVTGSALRHAQAAMALGFRALKMKIGWHPPATDLAWIEAVLDALPLDVNLAIDANRALDFASARWLASRISRPERIAWFEEPLSRAWPEAYRELRAAIAIPIAGAESMDLATTRAVVVDRAMDIVNPDLVGHGGFGAMTQLFALCAHAGVRLVPHCFDGEIIRVATLHQLAAQPDWEERAAPFRASPLECDISTNPTRDELLTAPLRPSAEGGIAVPTGPGLGVELRADTVARYGEMLDA